MPEYPHDVSFEQKDNIGTTIGAIYGDVNNYNTEGNATLVVKETPEERQEELTACWKQSGTCEWLKKKKPEFSTWIDMGNNHCFLWIQGSRGCGKTTMMSRLIEHVHDQWCQKDPKAIHLLYFYIGYGHDPKRQNTYRAMLMTFWDQMGNKKDARATNVFGKRSSDKDIEGALKNLLAKAERNVFIVVDALDQISPNEQRTVLLGLDSLVQNHKEQNRENGSRKVAVAISSRDCVGYNILEKHKRLLIQISATDNAEDIRKYVNMNLGSYIFDEEPDLKEQVFSELTNKADGMFLWAELQTKNICNFQSKRDVQNALQRLVPPKDIENMYSDYAIGFENEDQPTPRQVALRTIALLAQTGGSMPKETMLVALALDIEHGRPDKTTYDEISEQPAKIVRWCNHLIDINENIGVIRFCHVSVYEYFREYQTHTSHNRIAQLCLAHLCSSEFSNGPFPDAKWYNYGSLGSLLKENPFLEYSSHNWATSMKKSVEPGIALQRLQKSHEDIFGILKNILEKREAENLQLSFQVHLLAIGKSMPAEVCLEHIVSYFGLLDFLDVFYSNGWLDLKKRDKEGSTAIHWALRGEVGDDSGTKEIELVLQKLISYESDINSQDNRGRTPLYYASHGGKLHAVRLLLNNKAAINVQSKENETALIAASRKDHHEVIQELLEAGADVRIQSSLGTALQAVSLAGCTGCAHAILARYSAEPIIENSGPFGTPLHVAAFYGHLDILQLLLRSGKFDVRATNETYGSVLTAAATGCNLTIEPRPFKEIFQELISRHVDVNDPNGMYGPALRAAASCGDKELVEILLQAGADISRARGPMGTAYQAADERGHEDIRKLLSEKDPNSASYADHEPIDGLRMLRRLRRELFGVALVASNMGIINSLIEQVEKVFRVEIEKGETELLRTMASLSKEVFIDVIDLATRSSVRAASKGKWKAPKEQDIPEEGGQEDVSGRLREKELKEIIPQDQAGKRPIASETAPKDLAPEGLMQESTPGQEPVHQTSSIQPPGEQESLDVVQQFTRALDEHTQQGGPKEESPNRKTQLTSHQPRLSAEKSTGCRDVVRSLISHLCCAATQAKGRVAPSREVLAAPRLSVSQPPAMDGQHTSRQTTIQDQQPPQPTTTKKEMTSSPVTEREQLPSKPSTEQRQTVPELVSQNEPPRPKYFTGAEISSSSAGIEGATEQSQSAIEYKTSVAQTQSPPSSLRRQPSVISSSSRRTTSSFKFTILRRQASSFGRDGLEGRFPEVLDRLTVAAVNILAHAISNDEVKNDEIKNDKVKNDKVKNDKVKNDKVKNDKVKNDKVDSGKVTKLIARTWIDALQNLLLRVGFGEPMLQRVVQKRAEELMEHLTDKTLEETARFEKAYSLAQVGVELLLTAVSRKTRYKRLSLVLCKMWIMAVNRVEDLGAQGQEPVLRLVRIFAAKFSDAIKANDLVNADLIGEAGLEVLREAALSDKKSLMNKLVEEWVKQWQFAVEEGQNELTSKLVNRRLDEYEKHITEGRYDQAFGLAIAGIGLLRAAMEQKSEDVIDKLLPIIRAAFEGTTETINRSGSTTPEMVQAEEGPLPAEENDPSEQFDGGRSPIKYNNMNVVSTFEEVVSLFAIAKEKYPEHVDSLGLAVLRKAELLSSDIRDTLMAPVLQRVKRHKRGTEFHLNVEPISTAVLCLLNVAQGRIDELPQAVRALVDLAQQLPGLTDKPEFTHCNEATKERQKRKEKAGNVD